MVAAGSLRIRSPWRPGVPGPARKPSLRRHWSFLRQRRWKLASRVESQPDHLSDLAVGEILARGIASSERLDGPREQELSALVAGREPAAVWHRRGHVESGNRLGQRASYWVCALIPS